MSAQIIKLSDRRKTRPISSSSLIGLSVAIFVAYADLGLMIYRSIFDAAKQGVKSNSE
jgi:hypothetical protein